LTIQLNWIVKGFANVWLGRLSDFYGRKPVILCSFVVYIAATAGCAFSPNIYILLLARIVQAIGEANAVISSAIARDVLDDPSERMRMMAILGTIRPLAIIAAPSVGGLLGNYFGWRNVFIMLSSWGKYPDDESMPSALLPQHTLRHCFIITISPSHHLTIITISPSHHLTISPQES
jgi:MFS family permease